MIVRVRPSLTWLIVVLVLGVAAFALWPRSSTPQAADPCGAVTATPQTAGIPIAGQATLCLLNRQRAQHGLPPLLENRLLDTQAQLHSQDMVTRNYFEHTTPDGLSVEDRLRNAGYARNTNASAGENIAYGVGAKATPAAIVQAWMHSPPHRADILRRAFTEIGIGVALGAPEVGASKQAQSATYTTDFGGVPDPSLPNG
jgi:uncharacterized protein YkwD